MTASNAMHWFVFLVWQLPETAMGMGILGNCLLGAIRYSWYTSHWVIRSFPMCGFKFFHPAKSLPVFIILLYAHLPPSLIYLPYTSTRTLKFNHHPQTADLLLNPICDRNHNYIHKTISLKISSIWMTLMTPNLICNLLV